MSELRDRISEAAQHLYLTHGVDGVSMRKVAEHVGVSAPAIYRHFENKEALLQEIVVAGLRVLEGYLKPAIAADDPYTRLRRMIESFLEFALEQPKYFDFAFLAPDRKIGRFDEEVAKPMWDTFRLAIEQVAACMKQGVFSQGDPLSTSIMIWAEAHGLITLYRTGRFGPEPEPFRTLYHASVERMFEGLRAGTEERTR